MGAITTRSNGGSDDGFIGFLNSIPLWLYIVVAVLGLLITVLLFVLSGKARRAGGGGGAMGGGIAALLALVIAPLTLMTIGLLNEPSKPDVTVAGGDSTGSTSSGGRSTSSSSSSSSSGGGFGSSSSGGFGGSSSSGGDFGTSTGGTGSTSSGDDRALNALLTAAVAQARSQLPIRSGPATVTDLEADGDTVVMTMEISTSAQGRWSEFEPIMRRNICAGPFSRLIAMGASIQVDITDSEGEDYSLTVSRC